MARYTPVDTFVEYHDSLIDIKFKIVEAYLECKFCPIYRIPPYKTEHYELIDGYKFIIVANVDSCCTVNTEVSNNNIKDITWWSLFPSTEFYGHDESSIICQASRNIAWLKCNGALPQHMATCYTVRTLSRMKHNPQLDTIEIPIYLGDTYTNLVWEDYNGYQSFMYLKFILDDTVFQGDMYTYTSAQKALTKEYEHQMEHGVMFIGKNISISEIDSIYARRPKEELIKKLVWMYTDLATTPREK